MSIRCRTLHELLVNWLPNGFQCREDRDEVFVITPLMYPDGQYVSVSVMDTHLGYKVTDLGELWHYLIANDFPPRLSASRKLMLDDILRVNTTVLEDDEIRAVVQTEADLPFAIMRVAQSVARAADMIYSRRFIFPATFNAAVSDFFMEENIPFREDIDLSDPYGRRWRFDFLIESETDKYVRTLATESTQYAEAIIDRTIRQWDAFSSMALGERLTIVDDESEVWRSGSLKQLKNHSDVMFFSERENHIELLKS